jgi:hypothetical protein
LRLRDFLFHKTVQIDFDSSYNVVQVSNDNINIVYLYENKQHMEEWGESKKENQDVYEIPNNNMCVLECFGNLTDKISMISTYLLKSH